MAKKLELEVSNFIVRFGENYVLNDLLDEIVLPAFFSNSIREYRDTTYFFHEPQFIYLEKDNADSLALVCRFVKDTVLRRHQIYSPNEGIIADEHEINSAPSAIAILLLQSHRLLYVREVPGAPTAKQFGSTFKYFMNTATLNYQSAYYDEWKDSSEKLTKKKIRELFPIPDVDVVPLVASESLKEFLERFKQLKILKVELAATNNEIDNDEFFRLWRKINNGMDGKKSVVSYRSNEGLDTEGCYEYVEAAKQGNALVELKGEDQKGDNLVGTNENFSVKAQLSEDGKTRASRVKESFVKYKELLTDNVVDIGDHVSNYTTKLIESYKRFRHRKN
ncbi:hypothetical protein [Gimesia chilikensis]|uniref:hypothetical protein n=1 Tax=Gimesia chilikensis TaxID=2605989 RepID=UPI00118A5E1F|nr:hypothetical protein [Gimesia chilikensis]QDT83832.1 hypothetical protein MalM14_14670 [Gimesia chilikensis]